MPHAQSNSDSQKWSEQQVILLIADALDVSASKLSAQTKATDIPEWDSMGVLGILSTLDREGIKCDMGNTDSLQSVKGIIETCRAAGRAA